MNQIPNIEEAANTEVEEVVEEYLKEFPRMPEDLIGCVFNKEAVDEFNRARIRSVDWLRTTIHHQLQKAREEVINSVTITVLNSRTLEETTGIGVRESTARAQVCVDIRTKLLDHSELDQNITK